MPVVPFAPVTKKAQGPMPDEEWALMAAAQMHSEGRLVEQPAYEMDIPKEKPPNPSRDEFEMYIPPREPDDKVS